MVFAGCFAADSVRWRCPITGHPGEPKLIFGMLSQCNDFGCWQSHQTLNDDVIAQLSYPQPDYKNGASKSSLREGQR